MRDLLRNMGRRGAVRLARAVTPFGGGCMGRKPVGSCHAR